MKYTLKHLIGVVRQYKDNMVPLIKTTGTEEHKKYVRIERRLCALDVMIRRQLGIFIPDPCPLTIRSKDCSLCSGYTKKIPNDNLSTRKKFVVVVALETEAGITECPLKEVVVKNFRREWVTKKGGD